MLLRYTYSTQAEFAQNTSTLSTLSTSILDNGWSRSFRQTGDLELGLMADVCWKGGVARDKEICSAQ